MKAIAPGKLILSGEHAVVYGHPALALAVDRYACAQVTPQLSSLISFDISNLRYRSSHTYQTLKRLKNRLWQDYQAFLHGEYSIRDVLKKPFELSQFVLTHLLDKLNLTLPHGINLHTQSTIPMGCGMGSSAAMILCVLHALGQHLKLNLTPESYLSLGQEAENLQHGRSSGLDLKISLLGGALRYEQGKTEQRPLPTFPLYVVNTGPSLASTGECVAHCQRYLDHGTLGLEFAAVTEQVDAALLQQDALAFGQAIRHNHRLLMRIGVVPQKIQALILSLEQAGAAAKICGAGSIRGHNAGMVLIAAERDPSVICQQYGYLCHPIQGETRGLRTL